MAKPECPSCGGDMVKTHNQTTYTEYQEWKYTEDDRYLVDIRVPFDVEHFKCSTCKKRFYWGDTSYYDGFIEVH